MRKKHEEKGLNWLLLCISNPTFNSQVKLIRQNIFLKKINMKEKQDLVVWRPISANPGLNFNPNFFFFC